MYNNIHIFLVVTKVTNLPIIILSEFSHIFTKPTWIKSQILLIGAIITKNKRTVTSYLIAMELSHTSTDIDCGHGRIETRKCKVSTNLVGLVSTNSKVKW